MLWAMGLVGEPVGVRWIGKSKDQNDAEGREERHHRKDRKQKSVNWEESKKEKGTEKLKFEADMAED